MKKTAVTIVLLIVSFITFLTSAFGWLSMHSVLPTTINGSLIVGYFGGGDGSKDKVGDGSVVGPYILSEPRHVYNLAWLQYMGRLNEEQADGTIKQLYFEVTKDIPMGGLIIPPIGTEEYPFVGNFNGGGHVISNFEVTNVLGDGAITERPLSVVDMEDKASIVGFFGVVGALDSALASKIDQTTEITAVYDLYLKEFIVNTVTTESLIGLLAGYVNGNVTNVGIGESAMQIAAGVKPLSSMGVLDTNRIFSLYSLLGYYDSTNVSWDKLPTGAGTGLGSGDTEGEQGGSLKIFPHGESDLTSTTTSTPVKKVTGSMDGTAYYVHQMTVGENKMGKAYVVNSTALENVPDPDETTTATKSKYDNSTHLLSPSTNSTYYTFPFSHTVANNGTVAISYEEAPKLLSAATNVDSEFLTDYDVLLSDANKVKVITLSEVPDFTSTAYSYTKDNNTYYLPANGIWFKPKVSGKTVITFLATNLGSGMKFISLYRFQRKEDDPTTTANESLQVETSTIVEVVFPFKAQNPFKNSDVAYFEYPVSQNEVDQGCEYMIGLSSNHPDAAIALAYLRLAGTDENTGGDGTGGSTDGEYEYAITGVNFVDEDMPTNNPQFTTSIDDENYPVVVYRVAGAAASDSGYNALTAYYNRTGANAMTMQYIDSGSQFTISRFPTTITYGAPESKTSVPSVLPEAVANVRYVYKEERTEEQGAV